MSITTEERYQPWPEGGDIRRLFINLYQQQMLIFEIDTSRMQWLRLRTGVIQHLLKPW